MNLEVVVGSALAMLLVGLAFVFFRKQQDTLRQLRFGDSVPRDDRQYLYRQVYRRTIGCILMVVLAGLMVSWFFVAPEFAVRDLVVAEGDVMSDEVKDQVRFFVGYWGFFVLVFMALLTLAVLDWFSTARYGHRHRKQLEQDRKAALASEAARYRHPPPEWN